MPLENHGAGRRAREVVLFFALLLLYSYFIQPAAANALSRYDAVLAIAEQGTTRIDAYAQNTLDRGEYDGHFYSDKPPGVSLLSLPPYLALRTLLSPLGLWPLSDTYVVYLLNFVVSALPTALLALLLMRLWRRLGLDENAALLGAVAYGAGTLAFPFATLYFGHQTSAAFGFAAFYAVLTARERPRPALWLAGGGLLAGLAVVSEYPLLIVAGALAVYAFARYRRLSALLTYLAGGVPAALLLGFYNWVSFGDPLALSYRFVYLDAFAAMHQGIFGVTLPDPGVLFSLLFSGKGLFATAPVLLLAPLGVWGLWRRGWRAEGLLTATVLVLFALYNSGYFLPFGGWSPGPRFLVPALPFAAFALGPALADMRPRLLGWALVAVSVLMMLTITATVPMTGEDPALPWRDIWLPALRQQQMALNLGTLRFGLQGSLSLLPLAGALGLLVVAALLARRRPAWPGRLVAAPTLVSLALLGTLLWPGTLPGVPLAATSLARQDPTVVLDSVLERQVSGGVELEIVVRNVGGVAPNLAVWAFSQAPDGQRQSQRLLWPVTLLEGESARFTLTLPLDASAARDAHSETVTVLHSSLAYGLATMRVPASAVARQSQ